MGPGGIHDEGQLQLQQLELALAKPPTARIRAGVMTRMSHLT